MEEAFFILFHFIFNVQSAYVGDDADLGVEQQQQVLMMIDLSLSLSLSLSLPFLVILLTCDLTMIHTQCTVGGWLVVVPWASPDKNTAVSTPSLGYHRF